MRRIGAVPVRLRSRHEAERPTVDAALVGAAAGGYRTACAAPSIQLRFDPNGMITTCCRTLQPLGHIGRDRLRDIWSGSRRVDVERRLAVDDFSAGCQPCGAEIALEGRAASYAAIHDDLAGHLTDDPATRAWPTRMEFNLSNSCNLMCIQCDGESSSQIRLHREHLPPLPKVYGDEFFDDLQAFLPHLDHIVFAGGEPFLGAENFRAWDLIADVAPDLAIKVVTNATQWSDRIEAVLDRLDFSVVVSLDGITKATYESIRVGADFDAVMANVERFRSYTRRVGTSMSINHCLMPQNHHEFADLLSWAEDLGLGVDVSVVRTPAHACIASLPHERIVDVQRTLSACDDEMRSRLVINRRTWETELARIGAWAATGTADDDDSSHTVLWFRCAGSGATDPAGVRAELAGHAYDGVVHEVRVGVDDVVTSAEVDLGGPLDLVGGPYNELTKAVTSALGVMVDYEVLATSDDRVDARAVFGTTPTRIVTLAVRDDTGWATEAAIMLAFGATPGG